jgi:ATP/maltotriose-dependent transcriptional regulator MalT
VLAALRGQFQVAATLVASAERVLVPTGTNFLFAIVQMARAQAALGGGQPTEAYEELERMLNPRDPAYHPVISQWVIADFAEAAVHSGNVAGARTLVQELAGTFSKSSSRWTQLQARYANALLADDDVADPLYQAALAADVGRWPYVRGRVLLSYGAWLRRQRRVADSRAPLRAARDAFDALGASAWAERARQQLRASGESSPHRAAEARERLSPQEIQIAMMAAQGLSNRVIAQKLYVSHRTVGSHLYRIFPKLGITSRAQLSGVLPIKQVL